MSENEGKLPTYRSHKEVHALKIGEIRRMTVVEPGYADPREYYRLIGATAGEVEVSVGYIEKHEPKIHGYYVRYADGYESFSPRATFEGGYMLIGQQTEASLAQVAHDAFDRACLLFEDDHYTSDWDSVSAPMRKGWEAAAQAVEAAIRDRA